MARDYAKSKRGRAPARANTAARRRARDKAPVPANHKGLRGFVVGVITGMFLSLLVYLGTLAPTQQTQMAQQDDQQAEVPPPRPRFDFYTLLPKQSFDEEVEPDTVRSPAVEPAADVSKPRSLGEARDAYVLQAGSFRQREDADRRRAELLLLGLSPTVEETTGDNGRWYRVYLGPYETHSKMASARALTANQDIDTLVLKRPRP